MYITVVDAQDLVDQVAIMDAMVDADRLALVAVRVNAVDAQGHAQHVLETVVPAAQILVEVYALQIVMPHAVRSAMEHALER